MKEKNIIQFPKKEVERMKSIEEVIKLITNPYELDVKDDVLPTLVQFFEYHTRYVLGTDSTPAQEKRLKETLWKPKKV